MRDQDKSEQSFDVRQYLQSQSVLQTLKSSLDNRSAETLAREVLKRMEQRDIKGLIQAPDHEDIEQLCFALLSDDPQAGAQFVQDLRSDGASIEAAYLKYLAGAARMLGEWWESSRVSFAEVTIGTARMYAIMRALRNQFSDHYTSPDRYAVFASVPGETHLLGVRMAADLFRKDGWDIDLMIDKKHDELVEEISQSQALIVGISAGGVHSVEALSKLVIALRISTPKVHVFISGKITDEAKDAIDLMEPDGIVTEVAEAQKLMNAVVDAARGLRG